MSNINKPNNHSNFVPLNTDTLIIKGKFRFPTSGIYGVFALLLDEENRQEKNYINFLEVHLIASYFSDIYNINLTEPWSSLEKKFNKIRISGDFATSVTNIFYQGFRARFADSSGFAHNVVLDFQSKNLEKIQAVFQDLCLQIHKDRSVEIEIFPEEAYSHEIASLRQNRITEETNKIAQTSSLPVITPPPHAHHIPARPILAPVADGMPAKSLKPSMKIQMRIDDSTPTGKKWAHFFNLSTSSSGQLAPIIGTIDQIGPVIKNNIDIIVVYSPTQYSQFTIETGVKVKMEEANPVSEPFVDPTIILENKTNATNVSWVLLFKEPSFIIMLSIGTLLSVLSVFLWMTM